MATPLTRRAFNPMPGNTGAPSGTARNPSPNPITPQVPLRTGEYNAGGPQRLRPGEFVNPSAPTQPRTPVQPSPARVAPTGPTSGGSMTRGGVTTQVAPSMPRTGQSQGGTLTRGGVTTPATPAPVPNQGGSILFRGQTRNYPATGATPSAASFQGGGNRQFQSPQSLAASPSPVSSPTTDNAQQTESANPLTGDGNAQMEGTTSATPSGFSQRGAGTPRGIDATAARFRSPASQGIYADYIRRVFQPRGIGA